jgi:hypothetical protein
MALTALPVALPGRPLPPAPHDLARAIYLGFLAALCEGMGLKVKRVLALNPQTQARGPSAPRHEREGARARNLAMYLAICAADVRQVDVAHVVGVTPTAVCLACRAVEARLKSDSAIDALLTSAARAVMGGDTTSRGERLQRMDLLAHNALSEIGG